MKALNEEAFVSLIKRYESITLSELKNNQEPNDYSVVQSLNRITGFGHRETCTLCAAIKHCSQCVYFVAHRDNYSCLNGNNEPTYTAIKEAKTIRSLLKAIKKRAAYMKMVHEQYLKQNIFVY